MPLGIDKIFFNFFLLKTSIHVVFNQNLKDNILT